jgi:hypothetical protein
VGVAALAAPPPADEKAPNLPPAEAPTPAPPTDDPTATPPRGTPFHVDGEDLRVSEDQSHLTARNIIIRYPDRATGGEFVLTGDHGEVDRNTSLAILRGNVELKTPQGHIIRGDELTLNLRTREWWLKTGRTELTPELLQNGVLGSIFATGETVMGERGHMRLEQSRFTTCDLTRPHYHFRARSVDIYPGDRMIIRKATLFALGHRLFTLPTLVIPLRDRPYRRFPIVPEVGQNETEGYFVKAAYQYLLKNQLPGLLKLDLMQKRGVGTGVQQAYRLGAAGAGTFLLYNLLPKAGIAAEQSGHLQHMQQFGNIRADINGDFRRSDYQYAVAEGTSTTSVSGGLNLTRQVQNANTVLSLRQDETIGFGTFRTLASSLNHTQQFGQRFSGSFGADYITSTSGGSTAGGVTTQQLNSRLELRRQQKAYDLLLQANESSDLGSRGRGTSGLQRQPELSLTTDTYRFRRGLFATSLPLRLLVSAGRFHEEPQSLSTERYLMQLDLTNKRLERGSHSLDLNAMLRQSFYGDGGANYVVGANNRYTLAIGRESEFNLTHILQSPQGYTPFRFDFPYKQNRLESSLLIARGERFDVGFRTGYDFRAPEQFKWQNITMRLRWLPTPTSLFYLGTSYNPNPLGLPVGSDFRQKRLQTVVGQLRIRVPDGLKLDLGGRYDPSRSSFPAAKLAIETQVGRKWRFAGLFGYDGYSRFNDFMIIRDLHCWELALVRTDHRDWRREQGWRINLTIKAFPVFQRFGVGGSGQPLDTTVGDVF